MRSVADIRRLLNAGADKVSINTAAVTKSELVSEAAAFFGTQAIVAAVDAKAVNPDNSRWEIFTHGGRKPTGLDAVEWAREMQRRGAGEILLTSMDRDGTRQGFNLPLTRAVSEAVGIPVIASGGVGSVQHLIDGIKKAKPTPCWLPASSISAKSPSAGPKRPCAKQASKCGCKPVFQTASKPVEAV